MQVNADQWLSSEKAQLSLLVPSWVPSKIPLTEVQAHMPSQVSELDAQLSATPIETDTMMARDSTGASKVHHLFPRLVEETVESSSRRLKMSHKAWVHPWTWLKGRRFCLTSCYL